MKGIKIHNKHLFFCGENTICLTDYCSKGKLMIGHNTDVPVSSNVPDPDVELKNGSIKINTPLWNQRESNIFFHDGSTKQIYGPIIVVEGCDKKCQT